MQITANVKLKLNISSFCTPSRPHCSIEGGNLRGGYCFEVFEIHWSPRECVWVKSSASIFLFWLSSSYFAFDMLWFWMVNRTFCHRFVGVYWSEIKFRWLNINFGYETVPRNRLIGLVLWVYLTEYHGSLELVANVQHLSMVSAC